MNKVDQVLSKDRTGSNFVLSMILSNYHANYCYHCISHSFLCFLRPVGCVAVVILNQVKKNKS